MKHEIDMESGDLPILKKTKLDTSRQYLATITVCLGAICAGTVIGWTSPVLPKITQTTTANTTSDDTLHITESQSGNVGSLMAIGALLAALPAGYIADRIGRKRAIQAFTMCFLVQWALIVFAKSVFWLYAARVFGGVATGAMCVLCPMYIGEIAATTTRGALGSCFQLMLCLGILIDSILGLLPSWRTMSLIVSAIPVVFLVLFQTMPETPAYLVKTKRLTTAEAVLRLFRGPDYPNISSELKQIESDVEKPAGGISDLLATPANRRALLCSLMLMIFQQLSGINAVIFYTVQIFRSAGSSIPESAASILVVFIMWAMGFAVVATVERSGRKVFLMGSSTGMAASLAALGIFFHLQTHNKADGLGLLPLCSMIIFIVSFSMGYGPVAWMMMSELFAPEIRGVASGIAVLTNWGFVWLVTFCFPLMKAYLGAHVTFYVFAGVMGVATPFVFFVVPETKGRSLKEIQEALGR